MLLFVTSGIRVVMDSWLIQLALKVGGHIVAQPGVVIGNYAQIKPLNIMSGQLPDKSLVV